ncbi:uncharacterized protein LOC109830265 [Asparagus officinalis]|uniref:uncharacterized protein LOC109830265 n=1 Tax=Asparagus officinalis TaxID=4686 RepID=UPI00098DF278|nr:uncharacterized protein LOC109830265 [Asparagus officinalis]
MSCRALTLAFSSPQICCLSKNPNSTSRSQIERSLLCSTRSLSVRSCSSSWRQTSSHLDLPLLPFQSEEVLVPSECKTLHLYEARFLALLEELLLANKKTFVHFVLEPIITGRSSSGASLSARYGCLVLIEKIERLNTGALVSIRGVGRVGIMDIIQMEPYLRGTVIPRQDKVSDLEREMQPKLQELREYLCSLQALQLKLKASKDEQLQTQIKDSLLWAEREAYEDCDQSFVPKFDERLSFAALQPVSGFSQSETFSLQKEKLRAMDMRDTYERLEMGIKFVQQNIATVAAKLAIQSLDL